MADSIGGSNWAHINGSLSSKLPAKQDVHICSNDFTLQIAKREYRKSISSSSFYDREIAISRQDVAHILLIFLISLF